MSHHAQNYNLRPYRDPISLPAYSGHQKTPSHRLQRTSFALAQYVARGLGHGSLLHLPCRTPRIMHVPRPSHVNVVSISTIQPGIVVYIQYNISF